MKAPFFYYPLLYTSSFDPLKNLTIRTHRTENSKILGGSLASSPRKLLDFETIGILLRLFALPIFFRTSLLLLHLLIVLPVLFAPFFYCSSSRIVAAGTFKKFKNHSTNTRRSISCQDCFFILHPQDCFPLTIFFFPRLFLFLRVNMHPNETV